MKLSLFDLHCDTAMEMLYHKVGLAKNELAVSLEKAAVFSEYIQVMAHFTDHDLDDESGWSRFWEMLNNLKTDPSVLSGKASIVTACPDRHTSPLLFLGVEDVRILAGKPERVDALYDAGVRIITPLWFGETCIGGSHNTDQGLTPFGKQALERAVALGIILDISHASVASADDIFAISEAHHRPVIATHSDAYELCPVSRNLHNDQIDRIVRCGGLIGINLYQGFLKENGKATAEDALAHIDYFLTLGAERCLALGCDMDGCRLPDDVPNVEALPHLAELMSKHGYSDALIGDIFYQNAFRFAQKYFQN